MQSFYKFSVTVSSTIYEELSNPKILLAGRGDYCYFTNHNSDVNSKGSGYLISFNFYFSGEFFTRFGVCLDEYVGLGTETDGVNQYLRHNEPICSTYETIIHSKLRNTIVAFGSDIVHKGNGFFTTISLNYEA